MSYSLRQHSAFVLLDGIESRLTKGQITDRLIEAGVIQDDPGDYRAYQEIQAQAIIRQHRQAKERVQETQHELAHLFEVDDAGVKLDYYKPRGLLTPREALQDTVSWKKKVREDITKLTRYKDFYKGLHGRSFTRLLPKDLFDFAVVEPAGV